MLLREKLAPRAMKQAVRALPLNESNVTELLVCVPFFKALAVPMIMIDAGKMQSKAHSLKPESIPKMTVMSESLMAAITIMDRYTEHTV